MNRVLLSCVVCCATIANLAIAGPKGDVIARGVAPGTITVDGDFSDWPLDLFTTVSEQPLAPEAQLEFETNASGDHIVFDIDRVGFFNGTDPAELTKDGVQDFGIANYFAHDGEFLYLLGVAIDEAPRGDRDTTEHGSSGFLNDGWEIFIDAHNDTDDDAAGNSFPLFDEEEPNLDDMQITFALNDNFLPDDAGDEAIGVRQHMERAGTSALMGPIDPDTGEQVKNAPDPGGESYRAFLDAATENDGIPDAAGRLYDDLRAAGAQNPEIEANPNEEFSGYALEARIPFGIVDGFSPDEPVGFGLFWRDFDAEGDAGGASQSWLDWTQNEAVQCNAQEIIGLFCGANWGELLFDEVPEPENPLDCDGDGSTGVGDLSCAVSAGILAPLLEETGIVAGDLDGNGEVAFADFLTLSANFGKVDATYPEGDVDGNGEVAFADFLTLSANFGSTSAASVPEPTGRSLLLFACAVLRFQWRRRQAG